MPPNLHVKLSKLLSTWQPPALFNRMFSVVTYGRLLARAVANSLAQGEFEYAPIASTFSIKSVQSCSYSSPGEFVFKLF